MHGRLEPGVLRPYRHVLQRGGRRAPTHHTVTSCLYFITLGVKVLSSHLPAPDALNCADDVLRTKLTVLQQKRSGATCFPSMINAVRSSADVRKTSRTRRLLLRGQHRRDARTAQAFNDQRASLFAGSLDTTQVHWKPSRTSGLLLHEQPHRRSDALTSDALTD